MAFSDILSDFYAALSFTEVHAEAPPPEEEEKEEGEGDDGKEDEGGEGEDGDKEDGGEDGAEEGSEEGEDDEGEEEEEAEEEEEDEPEDIKPKLEEECAKSAQCAPLKHHYDACAERVTQQHENPNHKGPKEDCVEEFFHLSHCAGQCAAPKLFRQLR